MVLKYILILAIFLVFINDGICKSQTNFPKIIYKSRLPIIFVKGLPICPHNPTVLRFFGINVATRFQHWEDCIHFWTCQEFKKGSKKIPMKHSCPHTRVFDSKTEKCVFYKYANAPCNTAFDNLDERILKMYEKQYNDEIFQQHKKRIEQDKRQKEMGKKYQEQLQKKLIEDGKKAHEARIQTQLQRQAQLHNQQESHHRHTRAIKITDQDWHIPQIQINPNTEFYLHQFFNVKQDSNGVFSCPPVKLRPGITEEMIRVQAHLPHFQPLNYYDVSSFYNGLESRFPRMMANGSFDCGSYWKCGWTEHAFRLNNAFLMTCRNRAFQPTKIMSYLDLYTFSTVQKTGMCVPNSKAQGDDLKHCLHLNKGAEEVIRQDDFYGELSEKPKENNKDKEKEEEEIDLFKMIQDRYEEHETFIDDYIASIQGETDPGLDDSPDVNLFEEKEILEDLLEFSPSSNEEKV